MSKQLTKEWIQQRRGDLLKHKTILSNKVKSVDDIQVDPDQTVEDADQAQVYSMQDVCFGVKEQEIQRLQEIERALQKIADGDYGICEESGEPIAQKRLEKIPWARYTREVQEEMEQEKTSPLLAA